MTSQEQQAQGKGKPVENEAKRVEQANYSPAHELSDKELEAVSGGVTNTGTGGSNLTSGAGKSHIQ